ncbi:hypothetical protein HNQ69_001640 [Bartonella callosciuri]|uniref:Uncharacterized protein n=1 Tax=Bartonella callosciuri TaxID=686223 RepID=A0A840NVP1_9HYPH|nr:hypothetical protein [Bartonella callosciuri]MBB5074488.1 hypothetical protein [Bartonella callosciuri]
MLSEIINNIIAAFVGSVVSFLLAAVIKPLNKRARKEIDEELELFKRQTASLTELVNILWEEKTERDLGEKLNVSIVKIAPGIRNDQPDLPIIQIFLHIKNPTQTAIQIHSISLSEEKPFNFFLVKCRKENNNDEEKIITINIEQEKCINFTLYAIEPQKNPWVGLALMDNDELDLCLYIRSLKPHTLNTPDLVMHHSSPNLPNKIIEVHIPIPSLAPAKLYQNNQHINEVIP